MSRDRLIASFALLALVSVLVSPRSLPAQAPESPLFPVQGQTEKQPDAESEAAGLSADEMEQVKIWRRSYDVQPPALAPDDPRHPRNDPRYADLRPDDLPATECLKDTVERFVPYAQANIAPMIRAGKRVIITAHGNTLRALLKYVDKIADDEIAELNIPTGIPMVYELEDDLTPIRHYYLGDAQAI